MSVGKGSTSWGGVLERSWSSFPYAVERSESQVWAGEAGVGEGSNAILWGQAGISIAVRMESQKVDQAPAAHWHRACSMISA